MFLGTYFHNLDERNRLSIPKRFREKLGVAGIVTKGLDGCLFIYSREAWDKVEQKLLSMPLTRSDARSFSRLVLSGAMEVLLDRLGRIVLAKYLLEYAQISGEVAVLGVGERLEIWSKDRWQIYTRTVEKDSKDVAERLSELGI